MTSNLSYTDRTSTVFSPGGTASGRLPTFRGVAVCAALACLALAGCDKKKEESSKAGSGSATSGAASGKSELAGPCGEYAKRVCKEAGDKSPTCSAFNTVLPLMPPEACEEALEEVSFTVKKLAEARKDCDSLASKLCKDIGEKTETCSFVREQTKQFPAERCSMMLGRYADVLKELKQREQMNKPLSEEMQAKLVSGDAPSFGPKDAKVTVVEFSDFECPYCERAAKVVNQLKDKYGSKVRFVFRQFPLPMHPHAQDSAEASLAAHAQGKFWEFHDTLFENQRSLDRESLEKFAKEQGLNVAQFTKALEANTYEKAVAADKKLGEEISVRGTPTMFINGERVANPTDFEALSKQIEEALKG